MRVYENLDGPEPEHDVVLTIGSFDGVHLGHRYLLGELVRSAREAGRLSAVLTFYPHPRAVLHPERAPQYLTSREERDALLAETGIDLLVVLRFDRAMADMDGQDFVRSLVERLRMRELWVGRDFGLGRGRAVDVGRLQHLAEALGYRLHVVEPLTVDGAPVSSTRIRQLLAEGRVAEARVLLGRPVTFRARVVAGAHRGQQLGFRTANLPLDPNRAIPLDGVYVVWAIVGGMRHPAVANLGASPSFESNTRLLEVHLLDYDDDLYGREMTVEFVQRLRPVLRFPNREALVRQIANDAEEARRLLVGVRCGQ